MCSQNYATGSTVPDSDAYADHVVLEHHVVHFGTTVCHVWQPALYESKLQVNTGQYTRYTMG